MMNIFRRFPRRAVVMLHNPPGSYMGLQTKLRSKREGACGCQICGGKRGDPGTLSVKKGEEMDSASCTMHGDLVFPGIDTTKAERW